MYSFRPAPSNNPFPTMSDPTPYTVGLQPQYTSIQPQFTSFNPYQQQAEQEAAQADFLRQQQMFLQQQQAAQQQQQQQEEWMRQQMFLQQQQQQQQQQMQQQQQLFPQHTILPQPTGFGANNPFAPSPQMSPTPSNNNSLNPPSFNLQGTYQNHNSDNLGHLAQSTPSPQPLSSSPQPGQNRPITVKKKDNENQELANLFANRDDGMDTFGNTGALRYALLCPDIFKFCSLTVVI